MNIVRGLVVKWAYGSLLKKENAVEMQWKFILKRS